MPYVEPAQAESGNGCWTPQTEEGRDAVRGQLQRVLNSPPFRISRRYPRLLRHVVEQTLEGRADGLKERTLGVEVFGRDPAYDTNADPVVRMTAAQVRRRLAEYYQEAGRESEIRIELPVGSYVPLFRQPPGSESWAAPGPAAGVMVEAVPERPPQLEPQTEEAVPHAAPVTARRKRLVYLAAAVLVVALFTTYFTLIAPARETALERFWRPVWDSSKSVLICVGGGPPAEVSAGRQASAAPVQSPPQAPLTIRDVLRLNRIAWADALTFSALRGFLQANGRTVLVRRAGSTSLSEFRGVPAVLVGGYNNEWIMRLANQFRFSYSYQGDWPSGVYWITDRQNPSRRLGTVDISAPHSTFTEDYGIITRYTDPTTEHVTVVASGIMYYGTMAAGEFLTNPKYMEMVEASAPRGWQRKNLQVVFATRAIRGETGPPRILATHFW